MIGLELFTFIKRKQLIIYLKYVKVVNYILIFKYFKIYKYLKLVKTNWNYQIDDLYLCFNHQKSYTKLLYPKIILFFNILAFLINKTNLQFK